MIRAAVDDPAMARVVGIRVSHLFTIVFSLGAGLAGFAGVIGGPILSVYPGLDQDMLPLALVVVILGGTGRLLGSLVGSFVVGLSVQLRPGDLSRTGLRHAVPADAYRAGHPSAGPVRQGGTVMRAHRTGRCHGSSASSLSVFRGGEGRGEVGLTPPRGLTITVYGPPPHPDPLRPPGRRGKCCAQMGWVA